MQGRPPAGASSGQSPAKLTRRQLELELWLGAAEPLVCSGARPPRLSARPWSALARSKGRRCWHKGRPSDPGSLPGSPEALRGPLQTQRQARAKAWLRRFVLQQHKCCAWAWGGGGAAAVLQVPKRCVGLESLKGAHAQRCSEAPGSPYMQRRELEGKEGGRHKHTASLRMRA